MNKTKSMMIVGVGGQGTLLASRILGKVLIEQGYDVKLSEVHGMSQRGGSVVTYVKYGDRVSSPIVAPGEADVILAFELLEAARWLSYLKQGGQILVNTQQIAPMPVITGAATYPEQIVDRIRSLGCRIKPIDALGLAQKAGSAKAVNLVLLGLLSHGFDFPVELWEEAISTTVKPDFLTLNLEAFRLGREAKWEE
jgi:indolepyruvate ferredoxin oxidoreductase beta subunit